MVWVCKLVGPLDHPQLAAGRDPIQVSVESPVADDAYSDSHPSYIVDDGNVECELPLGAGSPTGDPSQSEQSGNP